MSAQRPSVPSADRAVDHPVDHAVDRFVSLRVPARGEVVLARLDDEPRPDALVLTRGADDPGEALEVRRVGRVDAESVELLPLDDARPPRVVPRAGDAVLGTVLLRWSMG
ncbi:MAG TPA: hypothetical protein VFX39_09680 [Gemmatimonadaceae bacterium]|nr:hypothetical protein [Gemmatimonadaceae bacterium]